MSNFNGFRSLKYSDLAKRFWDPKASHLLMGTIFSMVIQKNEKKATCGPKILKEEYVNTKHKSKYGRIESMQILKLSFIILKSLIHCSQVEIKKENMKTKSL